MNLPREKLIIFTAGYMIDKTTDTMDWIIAIDNFLITKSQTPMTKEERGFIHQLYEEAWLLMKTMGINRKEIREMGRRK